MFAPRRCMKPRPLLPSAHTSTSSPSACQALYCCSTMRSRLVLSAPHSPLSVVMTMMPTRFTESRATRNGCLYSGLACEMCAATLRIFSLFFFNDTATTEIYTLSLHDALPISHARHGGHGQRERTHREEPVVSTRSEEHTSELQSPDHLVCRLLLQKKSKK